MSTVDLIFMKIALFNVVTPTAQLVPGPSTSVSEMYIYKAKLTGRRYSCEAHPPYPTPDLTCFKLQNI